MFKKFLIGGSLVIFSCFLKAEKIVELEEIVVTATKTEARASELGSSVSVISEEEIKTRGETILFELLRDVVGVTTAQYTGFGGRASVSLRGALPGRTLVLIDGIKVNDPVSGLKGGRAFNFAHLTPDDIQRVEIIRGPQSTLYGSEAMGGVINIITQKSNTHKSIINWLAEVDTYRTFRQSIKITGGKRLNYSLTASRLHTPGISKAANKPGEKKILEKDGYENTTLSSRFNIELSPKIFIDSLLRYTQSETELDDHSPFDDDPNCKWMWENFISNISFSQFLTPNWNYKLSFNFARTNRAYRDESDAIDGEENKDKRYHGTTWQAEWQNNLCLSELILLTGGVEYEGELGAFHYSSGRRKGECPEKKLSNAALYFQKQLKIWNRLFITGGLRCDFPRFTQGVFNYKLSGSFRIPWIETWLKGSLGTGFIQPSFYQLYDPKYGNPDLKPEEIFGVDFGIEKWFQRSKISLRVFGNNFTNMIERKKLGEKKKYHNIDKAETKGLESEILVKPNQNLTWRWNYTYLKTKGKEGKPLLRQPQHKSSLILMGKFLEKVSFSLIGQYVGKRDGMDWSDWRNPKRVTLKEYFKVDLTLGFPFSERFRIFGKVENLFNTKYQEYYAYQARRRNFSFGISSQIGF